MNWRRFTPSQFEYDFDRDKLFAHRVSFEEAVECFFGDFEVRRNKTYRDRYQLIGRTFGGRKAQDYFPGKVELGSDHYRMAVMNRAKKKNKAVRLDQEQIDRMVISQAADNSAWEAPIRVRRPKAASLKIPGELAARAVFLARLHGEARVDKWVERVVRERVELEEVAIAEAKKELAS